MTEVRREIGERLLAVVRCGDESLHETWSGAERNFDFAVSYFGDNPRKLFPGARYVDRRKGGKWDGLFGFFQAFPQTVDVYDYFWFPDDDISADAADINRLISIARHHGLAIFQPSLDDESTTRTSSRCKTLASPLRYTNFVEIMVPALSRTLLKGTLPTMRETRSGFGLDFVWPRMAERLDGKNKWRSAIIDSVTVRHNRPVGGSLHTFINSVPGAQSSKEELIASLENTGEPRAARIGGVPVPRVRVLGGISRSGRRLAKPELCIKLAYDLMVSHRNKVQPVKHVSAIRHAAKSLV